MNDGNSIPDLPLRDIHLPDPISWWPIAPGWWMMILFSVCILATAYFLLRFLLRQTLKKQAIRTLNDIEAAFKESANGSVCVADLSILLRRIVISQNPKEGGVTGEAWLRLLDLPNGDEFSKGVGQILLTAPYQPEVEREQVVDLIELCRKKVHSL